MSERQIIQPIPSDYSPRAGDILCSALNTLMMVQFVDSGECCYYIYHGAFSELCRRPVLEFAELARIHAMSLDRVQDGGLL